LQITKYGHSCVLVEAEEGGEKRVALFDPGVWSTVPMENIPWIDDVFITHMHGDHCDLANIQTVTAKFPDVRITAPTEVVTWLRSQEIHNGADVMPAGVELLAAPHEEVRPFGSVVPEQVGVHFMGVFTHPGDCHTFSHSKEVLALPIVAPWGTTRRAVELALQLKPKYILPVHDWFLSDEARVWTYEAMANVLEPQGITLLKPQNGVAIELAF